MDIYVKMTSNKTIVGVSTSNISLVHILSKKFSNEN